MKVTTYGMLSFDDCELALRPEFAPYPISGDGREFCVILLSEIPLNLEKIEFGNFKIAPLIRQRPDFFKPYPLVLYLPNTFDFLSAPLVGEAVAALLSFALRRRVKAHRMPYSQPITNESQLHEDVYVRLPSISVGPELSLQQPLTLKEQKSRISILNMIYDKIVRMNKEDYLATIRALHLYQLALLTFREDIGLAYTSL